jgi:hypothetical protein
MSPKERDIVYIFVHNAGIVEQCRVVANNFSDDGKCLLYGLNSKAHFVADPNDMYESSDACMKATSKKNADEYAIYYDAFDSMEAVFLHSLYAGMTGKKLEELELLALINRASEFMGADVMSALEKYAKSMEKESKSKSKKKEGYVDAS